MKDPLNEIVEYLDRLPRGRAQVKPEELRGLFRGGNPEDPFWKQVSTWAEHNGLTMTTDGLTPVMASTYFFTKKGLS